MRGLSELLILQEIMQRIKHEANLDDVPLPCAYFDMIGGTSTGGWVVVVPEIMLCAYTRPSRRVIAIMLGRLRMSVSDAIRCYDSFSEKVFSKGKKVVGDGKFKASILEDVIKEIVEEKTGDTDTRMMDSRPEQESCKTYVEAVTGVVM